MANSTISAIEGLLGEARWLRALAYGLVHDDAVADDVAQESWLAALRSPPPADRPARRWLSRVARNVVKKRHRGESRRRAREIAASVDETAIRGAVDDPAQRAELQTALAAAVAALPEPFRSTIVLRYYDELGAAEVAKRQGVPAGTVRWRVKRALELLRQDLDARHGGERRTWMFALQPLAIAKASGSVSATTLKGLMTMTAMKTTIAAIAAIGAAVTTVAVIRGEAAPEVAPSGSPDPPGQPVAQGSSPPARAEAAVPASPMESHARRVTHAHERAALLSAMERVRRARTSAGAKTSSESTTERVASRTPTPEEERLLVEYIEKNVAEDLTPLLDECYDLAHEEDPKLGLGTLDVDVTLTGEPEIGTVVEDAELRSEEGLHEHEALSDCVRESMFSLVFPPPPIEDAKIKFTTRIVQRPTPTP